MRILSCVVQQDSILQTGVRADQSRRTPCSTAGIGQDISAAWFCSCYLLWCSDECVLLPWSTEFSAMTHKIRRVCAEVYAYCVNTLGQNVGLETWIWRQIV